MKRLLLLTLALLTAFTAGALVLSWDPNSETDLSGYKLYQSVSTTNGPWLNIATVGKVTTVTFTQSVPVAFYRLTAFNTAMLESEPSNIVGATNRPGAPVNLRIVP